MEITIKSKGSVVVQNDGPPQYLGNWEQLLQKKFKVPRRSC